MPLPRIRPDRRLRPATLLCLSIVLSGCASNAQIRGTSEARVQNLRLHLLQTPPGSLVTDRWTAEVSLFDSGAEARLVDERRTVMGELHGLKADVYREIGGETGFFGFALRLGAYGYRELRFRYQDMGEQKESKVDGVMVGVIFGVDGHINLGQGIDVGYTRVFWDHGIVRWIQLSTTREWYVTIGFPGVPVALRYGYRDMDLRMRDWGEDRARLDFSTTGWLVGLELYF